MTVTITLHDSLASQLRAQASMEKLPVEDLATQLLAEAVQQRARLATWQAANQRRVELIRKSTRGTLTGAEAEELERLQAELDERLEHWDDQLLGELSRMEQAVKSLPSYGN